MSESIKRFDPLTPMEDPDLVRFLGKQTPHKVALIPHSILRQGVGAAVGRTGAARGGRGGPRALRCQRR